MPIEATSDLVIGQWFDSPRLRAAIDAPLAMAREEVIPAFERVAEMRDIDKAEGVWLDYLGVRVGLDRPATTDPAQDARFGFTGPMQSTGFDNAPFAGSEANAQVYPLPDAIFRRFIKARAVLVLGDGTIQTFGKAVRRIDPGATVQDNRDMTVRIVTDLQDFLELADRCGALPRSGGVRIIYAARGVFGYDEAGEGFDQAPFRAPN